MIIDPTDKSIEELLVEISRLYRRTMHTSPHIVFHEDYKGTPESPKSLKRHSYQVDVGFFTYSDKTSNFVVLKSGFGARFELALRAIISEINADW